MYLSRPLRLGFVLTSLVPLCAADTWTVGPAGSGAQFTEIQLAIDAAQDDDVILVQDGTYQGFVVDKPLRILGNGNASITSLDPGGDGVEAVIAQDIAAGEELVLSGMRVSV